MTVADLITYIRLLTKTTSSHFSDDELITLIQIWLHKIQRTIAMARSDFFLTKDYTIVATGQEDIPLPDNSLEIKAVDVCYNADAAQKDQIWYKAEEIDVGQNPNAWDTIQKNATIEHPVYDVGDNRLWIAPIRADAIGSDKVVHIRLWYIERPTDPSTITDTPLISTINKNLLDYQPIIALGVAYDVLNSLGSPRAVEFYNQYISESGKMVREIRQQNIGAITASFPFNDGSQY